ncbi:DUF3034 family protein [Chitinimonas sp. PSY-7]|uniref:DUF3034 family protein n=1 Tax=Chitinimonas sp. PSY-7 TaxID=3459088 RepID=UPI00403FF5E4
MQRIVFYLLLNLTLLTPALAGSRLPATGGVTQIEGAGGGGLVPWALISGYGTRDEVGGGAFYTRVNTPGFSLTSVGAAVGLYDRVEVSFAHQSFDLGDTVPGTHIGQNILGLKVKLCGDAVFDQDRPWPQLAAGVMIKRNHDYDFVPKLLGAKHANDFEPYLAATKVWLDGPFGRSLLLNGTLRYTRANQFGILGFGGDRSDSRKLRAEASAGLFLTDSVIIGVEYRQKNNNLSVFKEDNAADAYIAWVPNKHISVTAAHAELGNIANKKRQRGPYLSLKADF